MGRNGKGKSREGRGEGRRTSKKARELRRAANDPSFLEESNGDVCRTEVGSTAVCVKKSGHIHPYSREVRLG